MKKIAFITECFPSEEKPYYCVYLYQQLKALIALGFEGEVVMPTRALSDGEMRECEFRGIKIIKIGYKTDKMSGLLGRISSGFKKKTVEIIRKKQYDLISLSLCSAAVEIASIKAAHSVGCKAAIHIHGLDAFRNHYISNKIISALSAHHSKKAICAADGIIGVSDKVCGVVTDKVKRQNVFTVYNGADTELFVPKEKTKNNEFKILSVANLLPIKGHKYIIEALRLLKSERPELKISADFIGQGPCKAELEAMAEGLDINFLGEKDYADVCRYMQRSDFYVMPSYYEAIGCVYFEAMCTATPVLGVRGCGIDEVLIDRENGYLVSPQNAREVADAISFAIDNPEKHRAIGLAGFKTVRESYTWEKSAQEFSRAIERLTER